MEFLTIVGGGYGLKVSDTDARGFFFSLHCSFNSTMGEKYAVYKPIVPQSTVGHSTVSRIKKGPITFEQKIELLTIVGGGYGLRCLTLMLAAFFFYALLF